MAKVKRPLFCRENGKRQLIRFVIFLGVLAWSFVVFKFFVEYVNISDAIAEIKENRVVAFGFLSGMLLAASLYTYLVHWHFRWWMGPCLVRAFWGILYMIPILNLFISKEAKEDISYAWKNMFKEEYKWEVNLFDFFPISKVRDDEAEMDNFFAPLFEIVFYSLFFPIYGIIRLGFFLILAFIIPVVSHLATLMGMGLFSIIPENGMFLVPVLGLVFLALVVFQYIVIPVVSFTKKP